MDISGFTQLVYNTDHTTGRNITLRLLSSIVRANRLGLAIAEIEGDAIFFYSFGTPPSRAEVLSQYGIMLDDFMRTLEKTDGPGEPHMELSLKMIVHCGAITQYRINDFKKLYGEVVLEAHLLLKNGTAGHSYVLMTDDYVNSLPDKGADGYGSKGSKVCEVLGGVKNVCYTYYDFSETAVRKVEEIIG